MRFYKSNWTLKTFLIACTLLPAILACMYWALQPRILEWQNEQISRDWYAAGAVPLFSDDQQRLVTLIANMRSSGSNSFDPSSLVLLEQHPDLEILGLQETEVRDSDLSVLQSMPRLKSLVLSKTKITDQGMKEIACLKHLECLLLQDTNISDVSVSILIEQKCLKELNLNGTRISQEGIRSIEQALPNTKITSNKKGGGDGLKFGEP